jgi:O-antigen/teichoic acid export membrane protein
MSGGQEKSGAVASSPPGDEPSTAPLAHDAVAPAEEALRLRRRARLGALLLTLRTIAQQLIVLGGMVSLARLLGPTDYGTFWLVQFALSFFTLFGDAGLGAALVQQRSPPTREELSTVFWAQLGIGCVVVAFVFAAAPFVVRFWPDLPPSSGNLMRALSVGFLLVSLRGLPAILMERSLEFGRLSALEVALSITFYGAAVALAALGWGVKSLIAAVLLQGVVGLVVAYAMRPFVPLFVFDRRGILPVLRFGVAFQTKGAVGFLNGAVTPILGGRLLGREQFGLVSWSQNTAWFSLKLVEILSRVNFPLFSRLQDRPAEFARTLEASVRLCAVATFLMVALFLGLGPGIVQVLYGTKWLPALPTLYVFAAVITIGFVSPILGGALDAIGRPQIVMRLSLAWTLLNWIAVPVAMAISPTKLAFALGLSVHVVFGNLAVVYVMKRMFPEARFFAAVRACVAACAVVSVGARWLVLPWLNGPATLVGAISVSALAFGALYAALDFRGAKSAFDNVRRKKAVT